PDDRAALELARRDDDRALEVAERLDEVLLVVGRDDHEGRLVLPLGDERGGALRRGRVERAAVDHRKRARLRVRGERGAERRALRLAVHLLHERARHLRKGVTAGGEVRRADRALPRTTGALLAPRLLTAA